MQSLCAALKSVHAAGIIHRDISPDNIYLCSNGTVKLIDFGSARFSKHESQQVLKMTQVMKPGFSPPEQYQSISEQGAWTDIYALGATLYYMITGVKPEESTNRKTEDNLVAPKELIPEISDYINDTILRAMAVDMHLRFSSVDEFEKALTKEKKVLNVAKEKKRRRKKRLIGLAAAVLVVASGLSVFSYTYNQQRLAETLPDSTIELWYALPGDPDADQAKKDAFKEIVTIFNESFPNVTIELKSYDQGDYITAINTAFKKDALPSMFESTDVDATVLRETQSVSKAVATVDSSKILFFDDYNKYFPDKNQFPLGFIAPARYTNTAPHEDTAPPSGSEREMFLAGLTKEYTGSTADFADVKDALPAKYEIAPVTGDVVCTFTDLWSIGKCDEDQLAVAQRLLVFLLSDNAQDFLHVRYQSNALPLNRETLTVFSTDVYSEFDGFFDNIKNYSFK
jgi:serine/threonine protein kinase